jgi:hypothetical protein
MGRIGSIVIGIRLAMKIDWASSSTYLELPLLDWAFIHMAFELRSFRFVVY